MVEFGLKLEDNKVSDWADKYIDYEKLKDTLTKLKAAMKRKEELFKRKPDIAEEVQLQYDISLQGDDRSGGMSQNPSLTVIDKYNNEEFHASPSKTSATAAVVDRVPSRSDMTSPVPTERDALLSRNMSEVSLMSGAGPGGATTASLHKTITGGVSQYFTKSYEKKIQDAIKQVDALHQKFHHQILREIEKVNEFYNQKVEELNKRLNVLVESVNGADSELPVHQHHNRRRTMTEIVVTKLKSMVPSTSMDASADKDPTNPDDMDEDDAMDQDLVKESESIQRALVDQYRTIKLLHNFSILNYTGFVKIVKKFNKTSKEQKNRYKDAVSSANICGNGQEVTDLEERMEQLYANWFSDGNVREARAQLLPKRGDGLQMDWSQLRLGYRLGMCAILTLWVCWDCVWGVVRDHNSTIGGRDAFPVFRGVGALLLLHWLWGVSVYVWTRFRVNYIFLFDLNPQTVRSPLTIFNDAVDQNLVFLVLMLLYYKAGVHDIPNIIPAGYFPFLLIIYATWCLIFPLSIRLPMWGAIFDVITAPLKSPTFFTTYIADVFTSMVKVFQDIAWSIGFVVSLDFRKSEDEISFSHHLHHWKNSFYYKNVLIPLICLFPLVIRFNQCLRKYLDSGKRFPNLANATKYAMSQTVTLFGTFHPLQLMHENHVEGKISWFQVFWTFVFVASSLYSYWWDIFMDWGLGQYKYNGLSPRLMYPHRSMYYTAMVLDIILRFMWVLTLIPPQSGASFELPQYLTAVTMALELMRRTMWGFFRLENEHRSNTNQYRRVNFVPLHFNTGHMHKHKAEKQHVGVSVLFEVAVVTVIVILISVTSVIAAQRAVNDYAESDL